MEHILAKDLRDSIIQAAIQGKLTKQNENEYVDLSKLNLKKYKRTEELGFEIPSNWLVIHLEDISNGISTKPYQIKDSEVLKDGKYKVVSQSKDLIIGFSNEKQKLFEHKNPVIVFGDHTTIIKYIDFDFVVGADGLKIFEPKHELLNPKYLEIALNYYTISLDKVGGYSRHYKFIKDKPIPLPPIEEQQRIIDKVDELMAKIDEYKKIENQLVQLKEEFPGDMKDAILQAAMQGKLTKQLSSDSSVLEYIENITKVKEELLKSKQIKKDKTTENDDEEYPFDIPENWSWIKFGKLATLRPGKTPPRAEPVWWGRVNEVPWISIADMIPNGKISKTKEYISKKGFEDKFHGVISPKGTLIMSFKLTIGRVSILDIDALHNEAIISILPFKDTDGTLQRYLMKVLPYLVKYGDSKNAIKGDTLNSDSLCNLYIPLPPIEEQQRIVDLLDKVLPLCDSLQEA